MSSTLIGKELYLRVMGSKFLRSSALEHDPKQIAASMKALIERHKKEIQQFTNLDLTAIANITYLNEFDRQIQYVDRQRIASSPCIVLTHT